MLWDENEVQSDGRSGPTPYLQTAELFEASFFPWPWLINLASLLSCNISLPHFNLNDCGVWRNSAVVKCLMNVGCGDSSEKLDKDSRRICPSKRYRKHSFFGFIFKCEQHKMLQSRKFTNDIELGNKGQKEAGLNINNTPKPFCGNRP